MEDFDRLKAQKDAIISREKQISSDLDHRPWTDIERAFDDFSMPSSARAQASWMPIDTAPRDGTTIFGYWQGVPGGNTDYGVTKFARGGWCNHLDEEDQWGAPSHWMPVPKGPELPSADLGSAAK